MRASCAMLLGLVIFTARIWGMIPNNDLTLFIILLMAAVEAILLSAALVDRVKTLREEKEYALLLFKNAEENSISNESAFLQAQIKPHFLYNTLNIIAALCRIDVGKARELILDLSSYLHYSFGFRNLAKYITFDEELEFIQAYVRIEQARFKDKLKVECEIEDTEGLRLPPLILQPLVENAIRHGIRKSDGGGAVALRVKNLVDCFLIEIEDDGAGMTTEQLEKIMSGSGTAGSGVGLANIQRRLKMLYRTHLTIQSRLGEGTRVTMILPKRKGQWLMKAVLVDDEYYALEGLRMELEDIGGIEVAGVFEDGQSLLGDIVRISPDVVFLDIEMPKMNGFELLKRLLETGIAPDIVFVTAYDHYAVKAFEINAVDYIVKPVSRTRLLKTLERIKPGVPPENRHKIEINCFRNFSIMADGQEISTGWRTRKAEELIAYLLCEKGRFVSKGKIAEALWPDLDGEKSVSNLYLAYYYIKKQENRLGVKIPIESIRGKMRIRMEEVDCDMTRFDGLMKAVTDKKASYGVALMERAVELYQGALLEDEYYSWAVALQQKYEIQYTRLLRSLMEYYERQSNTEKLKYYNEKLNTI